MTQARFLTPEEANLIQHAAQSWLRLRDVEFKAAEDAVAVLAASHVREEDCMRDDIATLGRTVLLAGFASDDTTRDPLALATPSPTFTEGEPA